MMKYPTTAHWNAMGNMSDDPDRAGGLAVATDRKSAYLMIYELDHANKKWMYTISLESPSDSCLEFMGDTSDWTDEQYLAEINENNPGTLDFVGDLDYPPQFTHGLVSWGEVPVEPVDDLDHHRLVQEWVVEKLKTLV